METVDYPGIGNKNLIKNMGTSTDFKSPMGRNISNTGVWSQERTQNKIQLCEILKFNY